MSEDAYDLFATPSDYTKNVQKYLDIILIICDINSTELVDLVWKYYDQLSAKYRKMIPLKMMHILVSVDE